MFLSFISKLLITTNLFLSITTGFTKHEDPSMHTGVWVTVFTEGKVFYSQKNADKMIYSCKNAGITDIYLQVYRAGEAFYNSSSFPRTHYDKMSKNFGSDPVTYILNKASENNIRVHAWFNILSLAKNENADIIKKIGFSALTLDKYGRASNEESENDEFSKYYIREDQLFLEPGNTEVVQYLTNVAEEIFIKHPNFSGLHMDYIRYPGIVPFVPGSRFDTHGLSYGYTYRNMTAFKKTTGLDIKKMKYDRKNFLKWDDWRRNNVTTLVRSISDKVRSISPDAKISCAVMPSPERSYLVNFQDWPKWLREGTIDYVVGMDYTDDPNLCVLYARSMLHADFKNRVYIGLGAYLLKKNPEILNQEIEKIKKLKPAGIVYFSYDDLKSIPFDTER